jgi:long-chain acyl-CoA synthetase
MTPSPAPDLFRRIAGADQARRPWLRTETRTVTYGDLAERARRLAGLLAAEGVRPGDRVVLASRDDAEAALLFTALVLNGVTAILHDAETGAERARGLTAKAAPSLVLVDRSLNAEWDLSGPWPVIEIVPGPARAGGLGSLLAPKAKAEGLLARLAEVEPADPPDAIPGETLAYILFTSGTTKAPKGVCISHAALFAHLATLGRVFGYDRDSRILNTLMLSHADGVVQGPLVALVHGCVVHRPVRFEVGTLDRFLDAVYQLRITHLVAVPTMLALLLRLAGGQRDAFAGGDFRLAISCAAALEPRLWQGVEETFGIELLNMYGLTETVTGGMFKRGAAADGKYGSVGRPIDCEVRLVDEDGRAVPEGETGELLIRGPNLMSGYFDEPEQTAEALRDGWLHTGDTARRDADGDLWVLGRKKNIIIRGGLNIHPEEISEVLNAHPGVLEAVAYGAPDPDWGETVVAVAAAPRLSEADLRAWCLGRLEPRKIPSRIVVVDELPRGRSGKVVLSEARALAERAPDASPEPTGNVEQRLLAVAARCFKTQADRLSLSASPADVLGWDSLAHLELVMAVETEFGVKLTARQIMTLDRLDKLLDHLQAA